MTKRLLCFAASLVALTAPLAWAGDVTLTNSADLYRLQQTEDGLLLTITPAEGEGFASLVPQTAGIVASSLNVGVDEATGTVLTVWQEGDTDIAELRLATFDHGTWQGPVTIDGSTSAPALYPELLMHRAVTMVEDEDGELAEVTDTFAHLAWWRTGDGGQTGTAMYAALRLDQEGLPELDRLDPFALRDLVPWGIGCHGVADVSQLAHPKLFIDPQTGDPHVMATDFGKCLVQIVQLEPALDTDVEIGKRGRQIILFGRTAVIGVNPMVDMAKADIDVGHDLSVVLYWDVEGAIKYATMRESGWSEVKSLPVGDGLSHEKATQLIRALAR